MAKKKAVKTIAKKKVWVEIIAPKMFNSQPIGETHVVDSRQVIGKSLKINLSALTGSHKKQTVTISFEVTGLHDGKGITEISGYKIANSSVKRMMRRGKSKVEDSFVCFTSDKKKVRIKPIAVTRTKANNSVLNAIRMVLREVIARAASKQNFINFMGDVIDYKLQKGMYERAKKVFPVSVCEVRWALLVPEKSYAKKTAPEEAAKEEPKEEKPAEKPKEEKAAEPEAKPAEEKKAEPKEEKKDEAVEEKKEEPAEIKEVAESAEASN